MLIKEVKVDFLAGTDINKAVSEAVGFSLDNDTCIVKFSFNGVPCELTAKSNTMEALHQYHKILTAKVTGIRD